MLHKAIGIARLVLVLASDLANVVLPIDNNMQAAS